VRELHPLFLTLLARSIAPQWDLLTAKFKGIDERIMPPRVVQSMRKALVHEGVRHALAVRDKLQLLKDCANLEVEQLDRATCLMCHCSAPQQSSPLRRTGSSGLLAARESGISVRRLSSSAADTALWVSLRRACLTDAPHAFASRLEDFVEGSPNYAHFVARLADDERRYFNLVAEDAQEDGKGVGLVSGFIDRAQLQQDADDEEQKHASVPFAYLHSMWVSPSVRGRGVGEALILPVLRWAAASGARTIRLEVRRDNPAAIRLYKRLGFEECTAPAVVANIKDKKNMLMERSLRTGSDSGESSSAAAAAASSSAGSPSISLEPSTAAAAAAAVPSELHFCSERCAHTCCLRCVRRYVLAAVARRACLDLKCPSAGCAHELHPRLIRASLSAAQFNAYNDLCFTLTTEDPSKFVRCPDPSCGELTEHVTTAPGGGGGGALLRVPVGDIKMTDDSGKVLSVDAWRHFSTFRMRCRGKCEQDFCVSCRARPYHLGKTCAQFAAWQTARHCRVCTQQLKPGEGGEEGTWLVCEDPACRALKQRACTRKLACGHACFGVNGESEHPPCLEEDCPSAADSKVDGGENCAICYVEELRHAGPVVQLTSCGHVYHEACVLEKLRKRWSGTRITFGFLDCSQCKAPMQHPSPPIQTLLQPILALRKEVSAKALARLTIENMTKDAKLVDPKSQFYNKPEAYATASFAYYNCFK
jgi:ribosomal protein S18 acetylase RimI-like enzyme